MALPVMSSGHSLLRFRLLDVPVRVDTTFLLLFAFFGFARGDSLELVVIWVLSAGVSILVHEMGHALVARAAGAEPVVELHGMGGLTSWSGAHDLSRGRMLAISIAGPGCGLLLGGLLWVLYDNGLGAGSPLVRISLQEAVFINVLWGALNLLPILPLDGGQVMRDLLPGDLIHRQRTAAAISVVIGAVAALLAFSTGRLFAGAFAAYFALTNLTSLRAARPRSLPPDVLALHEAQRLMGEGSVAEGVELAKQVADQSAVPGMHATATQVAAQGLLRLGRADDAKLLLIDLPVGSVDRVLEAEVLAATGQVDLAVDRLRAAYAAAPGGRAAFVLAQLLAQHGRAGEVLWMFADADPELALAAASGADAGGAPDIATRLRAASAAR
jgi:Zn-dependent protease